jgi:hypothetical protein
MRDSGTADSNGFFVPFTRRAHGMGIGFTDDETADLVAFLRTL